MIPDYPPPSFQEAIMTPPFIPPPPPTEQEQSPDVEQGELPQEPQENGPEQPADTSSPPASSAQTIAPPPASPPPLTVHTDITFPANPVSHRFPGHADSSSTSDHSTSDSSVELVNLDTESWDQERRLGVPLPRRVEREFRRQQVAESTTALVPHPPRLFDKRDDLTHHRCSHCGSPKPSECGNAALPSAHGFGHPDNHSPPSSPKGRRWKNLFIPTTGTHDADNPPLSPTPSSPRSPKFGFLSAARGSSLTLATSGSPSPSKPFANSPFVQRKESSVVRRLFGAKAGHSPKGKERESPDQASSRASLEEWEVVDRNSDSEASRGNEPSLSSASEGSDQSHTDQRVHTRNRAPSRPAPTSPPRSDTPPAFINRSVRHSPQSLSPFPMFASNSSVVSLPLAGPTGYESYQTFHPSSSTLDLFREPQTPSSPLSPRRKAMSTLRASPSVVWLPLLKSSPADDEDSYTMPAVPLRSGAPELQMRMQPHTRNLSIPFVQPFDTAVLSGTSATPMLSVIPAMRFAGDSPVRGYVHPQTPTVLRTPTLRSPASAMTLNSMLDGPNTPSTPIRHYHGRPLPHPPPASGSPDRLMLTPAMGSEKLPLPVTEQTSDESPLRADGYEHSDGALGEVCFRVTNVRGCLPIEDQDAPHLPPTGRVELKRRRVTKDGHVRLKLTLMDVVVDKCGICLSQFKEAEVACHGSHCRHT